MRMFAVNLQPAPASGFTRAAAFEKGAHHLHPSLREKVAAETYAGLYGSPTRLDEEHIVGAKSSTQVSVPDGHRSPSPRHATDSQHHHATGSQHHHSSPNHLLHPHPAHHRHPSPGRHVAGSDGDHNKVPLGHEHDRKTHAQELQDTLQDINEHAVEVALFEKHEAHAQSPAVPNARAREQSSGPQATHKYFEPRSRAHVMQKAHHDGLI